jgi:hypothetical protein
MKTELDDELCTNYPKIFKQRRGSMTETAMCWGFACGDGWYNIINQLCWNIQQHIDWSRESRARALRYNRALARSTPENFEPLVRYFARGQDVAPWHIEMASKAIQNNKPQLVSEASPQVVATQVKEKFGTLRFYYDGGDSKIDGMVRMAESMSGCTCEVCGSPGEIRGCGWISCQCDAHA